MQGGGGVELVAAVSNAGALGVLPTFGGTEDKLRQDIEDVKKLTEKPFGVNITAMGRGFTESRANIIIEYGVPVCTTGRADPGEKAVRMKIARESRFRHSDCQLAAYGAGRADAIVASGTEVSGHVHLFRRCRWFLW